MRKKLTPEQKERKKKYLLEYRAKNREELLEQQRVKQRATPRKRKKLTQEQKDRKNKQRREKRLANPELYSEINNQKWRKRYAENKDEILAKQKKWREENSELYAERQKRCYKKDRDKRLEGLKAKRRADPEAARLKGEKSRERAKEKLNALTIEEQEIVLQKRKQKRKECNSKYRAKNKEAIDLRNKEFAKNNKKRLQEYRKEYRLQNIERIRKYAAEYIQLHPEMVIKRDAVRRARVELNTTQEERDAADKLIRKLKRQKHISCPYCDCDLTGKTRHIDHIVPLARGGLHIAENLCAACPSCNTSKNDRILFVEWFPKNYQKKAS